MEDKTYPNRRTTIAAIARLAGVGTATVDRVLNGRGNVRDATRQRVEQAKAALETGSAPQQMRRPWRLKVLLPGMAGASTNYLAECFQEFGARGNATIECEFTRKMEPALLARKLTACAGQGIDAVAFQALEDPRIHNAVDHLHKLNILTLALLSGIPGQNLIGTIGTDNRTAGRTAGLMMGRLTRQSGKVAILSGGQLYRVHEDREMGFRAALRAEFGHILEPFVLNGHDDAEANYGVLRDALDAHPELVGIYNVGGGNEGIAKAMQEAGVANEIVFIGHNLTTHTQSYLLDVTMDIVLHLNMRDVAKTCVDVLTSHLDGHTAAPGIFPTMIVTKENLVGMDVAPAS